MTSFVQERVAVVEVAVVQASVGTVGLGPVGAGAEVLPALLGGSLGVPGV